MEGVTLLESGTSRAHFALSKQLEQAPSASAAYGLALHTLTLLRGTLTSTSYASPTSLCSHLLVLLHILRCFPALGAQADVESWALVPSLHLAATGTTSRQVCVAYQLLACLLLRTNKSKEEESTSLLQLNTLRSHLAAQPDTPLARVRLHCALVHTIEALHAGTIGAESLPALWAPLLHLTRCVDAGVRERAVCALGALSRLGDEGIKAVARSRLGEVLARAEAPLEQSLRGEASDSSSRRKEKGKERESSARIKHGSRRHRPKEAQVPQHTGPETEGSVKLAALRALRLALRAKETQPEAVAMSALEVLRQAGSAALQATLLLGALELLLECTETQQLSPPLVTEIRSATLALLVLTAPQQTGSAFALQVGAAQLLGALHSTASTSATSASAEDEAGWAALNAVLKAHLGGKNANRRAVGVRMLSALVPLGWAAAPGAAEEALIGEAEEKGNKEEKETMERRKAGVVLQESEFAALMSGLAHPDSTVRTLTLRLLHRIDASIVAQHQLSLLRAIPVSGANEAQGVAGRALECAWVRASCAMGTGGEVKSAAEEYAACVGEVLRCLGKVREGETENWVVEAVLGHARGGATAFGALVTETLLQRLAKAEDQHLGSTECLLLAALLVEWAHELQEIEVQRERVLDVLSMVIGKASIEEALLLALIRLSASQPAPSADHVTRVEKLLEQNEVPHLSKSAAGRARQYLRLARDEDAAKRVNEAAGNAPSLLDLIEALDAYFSTLSISSASSATRPAAISAPKPLRFEPYAPPSASASSSRDLESQSSHPQAQLGAWSSQGSGRGTMANVVEALGASVSKLSFLGLKDEWGEGGRYDSVPSSAMPLLEQEEEDEPRSPLRASTQAASRGRKSTSSRPDLILFDAESER